MAWNSIHMLSEQAVFRKEHNGDSRDNHLLLSAIAAALRKEMDKHSVSEGFK